MKLHYYPETDSLYIELAARPGVQAREIADGLNVDFDAEGGIVGLTSTARRKNSISPRSKPSPCRSRPHEPLSQGYDASRQIVAKGARTIFVSNCFMRNKIYDIPISSCRTDRDWRAAPDASSVEVEVASSLAGEKEKGHAG